MYIRIQTIILGWFSSICLFGYKLLYQFIWSELFNIYFKFQTLMFSITFLLAISRGEKGILIFLIKQRYWSSKSIWNKAHFSKWIVYMYVQCTFSCVAIVDHQFGKKLILRQPSSCPLLSRAEVGVPSRFIETYYGDQVLSPIRLWPVTPSLPARCVTQNSSTGPPFWEIGI
jgi:hypothetical protein